VARLDFEPPALAVFPCLGLAYRALSSPTSAAVALNAANEIAVALFLDGRISFPTIARLIARTLDDHEALDVPTLDAVRHVDRWAREHARELARGVELKV
jgi:1-deoxy-D-xylulose-5-phosphate reductoisomerase